MCCFTQRVESVSNTSIFARELNSPMQLLVYSMTISASVDLAMILPIPVAKGSGEKSVKFINLEKHPDFFTGIDSGFPAPPGSAAAAPARTDNKPQLEVVDVGAYEASFVPTTGDFSRLDERFRLPVNVWDKIPQYKDYGFSVFKLKKGNHHVHPMAFEFPRANPRQLFFPTVHIHDGLVHETAEFDHSLFAQLGMNHIMMAKGWFESQQPAGMFKEIGKCANLVDLNSHVYKRAIHGRRQNGDTVV